MPTYEYRCTACGNELEAVQKFSDPALTECPQCQGLLRKVFSPVGVVFKGSGFYATDNRTKGKANASAAGGAAADSASSTDSSSSSSAASETGGASSATGSAAPAPTPSAKESKPATKQVSGSTPTTG